MVYSYKDWTLHKRNVILKGGGEQTIYFFAKGKPKSGTPCDIPEGYELLKTDERKGSGMPYLKKK